MAERRQGRLTIVRDRFWERYPLGELDAAEWEALCDGCGKCCLKKFTDNDREVVREEVLYTGVACRELNIESCRCSSYTQRHNKVPDCTDVKVDINWDWLPATCAYRLRAEDKHLFEWHPLISGSPASVHQAGISVRGKVLSEEYIHPEDLEQHIIHWVD